MLPIASDMQKSLQITMNRSKSRIKKTPTYNDGQTLSGWRESLNDIIFGSETPAGKAFDVILIVCIVFSVIVVMLDSVSDIQQHYGQLLYSLEWLFTGLFTIEYVLRVITVRRPWLYITSFFGLVDVLSILPNYLILLFPGISIKYVLVIRVLRMLRIFRILKLSAYMLEADILVAALANSTRKITVFLYAVLTLVIIFGSLIYVVEGSEAGFTSIPTSMYWAIVTITTVGYGDIAPATPLGQMIAGILMITGYGVIAVPTGIYSAEIIKSYKNEKIRNDACPNCGATDHDFDASFCKFCGHRLDEG